jgi:hypothetical protein
MCLHPELLYPCNPALAGNIRGCTKPNGPFICYFSFYFVLLFVCYLFVGRRYNFAAVAREGGVDNISVVLLIAEGSSTLSYMNSSLT